jgi:hypothetical protein
VRLPMNPFISPRRVVRRTLRTDRKIICLRWARGSCPGPGVVIGPGQRHMELGGLGKGDVEAERFDLPHVVAEPAAGFGAGLVVAVAEVGEAGCGVTEQVPDDHQEGSLTELSALSVKAVSVVI